MADATTTQAKSNAQLTEDAVTDKLANTLKDVIGLIPLITGKDIIIPVKEDNAEYRRIADGLIKDRKFTIKNNKGETETITIAELDEGLDDQKKKALKEKYGHEELKNLIPTEAKRKAIGKAVDDSVNENTWLFGTNFSSLISAVIEWIGGYFSDSGNKKGFMEILTNKTADSISHSLENKLSAPGLGLSKDDIKEINDGVRSKIFEKKGYTDPRKTTPATPEIPSAPSTQTPSPASQPEVRTDRTIDIPAEFIVAGGAAAATAAAVTKNIQERKPATIVESPTPVERTAALERETPPIVTFDVQSRGEPKLYKDKKIPDAPKTEIPQIVKEKASAAASPIIQAQPAKEPEPQKAAPAATLVAENATGTITTTKSEPKPGGESQKPKVRTSKGKGKTTDGQDITKTSPSTAPTPTADKQPVPPAESQPTLSASAKPPESTPPAKPAEPAPKPEALLNTVMALTKSIMDKDDGKPKSAKTPNEQKEHEEFIRYTAGVMHRVIENNPVDLNNTNALKDKIVAALTSDPKIMGEMRKEAIRQGVPARGADRAILEGVDPIPFFKPERSPSISEIVKNNLDKNIDALKQARAQDEAGKEKKVAFNMGISDGPQYSQARGTPLQRGELAIS